ANPDLSQPDGWGHALGPMQFLPATWGRWGTVAPDRPPGAAPDVQNAWDAIFSAAAMLCGGQHRLDDVRAALLGYNHSSAYVDEVLRKAAAYGLGAAAGLPPGATATGSAAAVVTAAVSMVGTPYVWG